MSKSRQLSHLRRSATEHPWRGSTKPSENQENPPIYQGFPRQFRRWLARGLQRPRRPHEENRHVQAHHRSHARPQPGRRPDLQPPRQAGLRQGPGAAQRLHPRLADLRRGHHPAAAGRTLPRLGVRRGPGALHLALRHHHPPRRRIAARRDRDHRGNRAALLSGQGRAHRGTRHGGSRRHHDGRRPLLHRRIGPHQRRGRPADDRDPGETWPQRLGGAPGKGPAPEDRARLPGTQQPAGRRRVRQQAGVPGLQHHRDPRRGVLRRQLHLGQRKGDHARRLSPDPREDRPPRLPGEWTPPNIARSTAASVACRCASEPCRGGPTRRLRQHPGAGSACAWCDIPGCSFGGATWPIRTRENWGCRR